MYEGPTTHSVWLVCLCVSADVRHVYTLAPGSLRSHNLLVQLIKHRRLTQKRRIICGHLPPPTHTHTQDRPTHHSQHKTPVMMKGDLLRVTQIGDPTLTKNHVFQAIMLMFQSATSRKRCLMCLDGKPALI